MLGKPVPDFSLPKHRRQPLPIERASRNEAGSVFPPLGQQHARLHAAGGVSRDSPKSHESFKTKMNFRFERLADGEENLSTQFGVMKQKNTYAKKVRGIERSTFVNDAKGWLAREWRGVKVPGHVEEVLSFVKAL